jgi:hypothetical protein
MPCRYCEGKGCAHCAPYDEAHSRSEYKRLTTLKGEPNLLAENARLKAENLRYVDALMKIRDLDPNLDTDEGFNEWGEAKCFQLAKDAARAALAEEP